jgi:SAM-dependent methyltransferase
VTRAEQRVAPIGRTPRVLVRDDGACAYPIVDGVPVLLAPEMLMQPDQIQSFDLSSPQYAEAYEEMEYYSSVGGAAVKVIEEGLETADERRTTFPELARELGVPELTRALGARESARASFPHPREIWIDARFEAAAQWEGYVHLSPVAGKRVLQIGGDGRHAVKFLAAGAKEAIVVSPMLGELSFARALARHAGLADRLRTVAGVAEEIPLRSETVDVIWAGACVHHMVTELALPEIARILRPGGKFAAIEPWRAPFYGIGTKILGKREPEVHCRPMTAARVEPLFAAFDEARVLHHGSLTRYALIALARLGYSVKISTAWKINAIDDFVCSYVPPLRRMGSSVALLGSVS